jgi:thiol:disulfide interchange protein
MNCRTMESGTFLDDAIQKEFGRFVEIRIHTDHNEPELAYQGKKLQQEKFNLVGAPYYAVLDPTGEKVYWSRGGVVGTEEFLEGLRKAPGKPVE